MANIPFWDQSKWLPYSPDVNPLDFSVWWHVESRACPICHPNVEALKQSVDEHWNAMTPNYICKTCSTFRTRIEAIIAADGGYIE